MAERQGPLALGYVRWSPGPQERPSPVVAEGIALMEAYAQRCGYNLGEVFVDDDPSLALGWGSLVSMVRVMRPVSVLVPDVPELRLPGRGLELLRARLRHITTAPLVVARPEMAWGVREALAAASEADARPRSQVRSGMVAARRAARARRGWELTWGR